MSFTTNTTQMRIRVLALVALIILCGWNAPTLTNLALGQQAYSDLVGRFWRGAAGLQSPYPAAGFIVNTPGPGETVLTLGQSIQRCLGCQWSFHHVANAYYADWKATGSADAKNRVGTWWYWIKNQYVATGLTVCGNVTNTAATASDDATWTAGFYLQAYEATNDGAALTAAKGMLDCVWNRWSDGGAAGCTGTGAAVGTGIWYSDACTSKSSYQNVFALDNYRYYQLAADATYRTRALSLDTWLAANLQRQGQTVQGQVYPNDGLYWVTMNSNGTIAGINTPTQIQPGSSVTLMAGDMAEAVLDARLYADTGTNSYLTRLQLTSQGMHTYYRDGNGVIVAMRDARVDGWAAYLYANEIINAGLLPVGGLSTVDYRLTASAVNSNARAADMSYAGCWDGPSSNSSCLWAESPGFNYSEHVEISANAAIWPIANTVLP
jgi:hypothetical protein